MKSIGKLERHLLFKICDHRQISNFGSSCQSIQRDDRNKKSKYAASFNNLRNASQNFGKDGIIIYFE